MFIVIMDSRAFVRLLERHDIPGLLTLESGAGNMEQVAGFDIARRGQLSR